MALEVWSRLGSGEYEESDYLHTRTHTPLIIIMPVLHYLQL
jgi:hypothetical protein